MQSDDCNRKHKICTKLSLGIAEGKTSNSIPPRTSPVAHLEGQFVLLVVLERPHLVDDVLEVRLHEVDRGLKLLPNRLLRTLGPLVVIVTATIVIEIGRAQRSLR